MNVSYNLSDSAAACVAGTGIFGLVLTIALVVCCIVAYFLTIAALVKAARAKGAPHGSGKLWFIGIFTTPITLGVLVAALPDRGQN